MKTLEDLIDESLTDKYHGDIYSEDVINLAIEWIKNDIKNSTKIIQIGLTGMGQHQILPNGKFCICSGTNMCIYHREGKRLMKFLNITEDDLK